ncbi:hypothetical protein C8J56DRAFT_1066754 [Mycena floridula]|nr:hypothetical protein C8J56DRAFT_1066754 [Mycena floridula]
MSSIAMKRRRDSGHIEEMRIWETLEANHKSIRVRGFMVLLTILILRPSSSPISFNHPFTPSKLSYTAASMAPKPLLLSFRQELRSNRRHIVPLQPGGVDSALTEAALGQGEARALRALMGAVIIGNARRKSRNRRKQTTNPFPPIPSDLFAASLLPRHLLINQTQCRMHPMANPFRKTLFISILPSSPITATPCDVEGRKANEMPGPSCETSKPIMGAETRRPRVFAGYDHVS